MGQEYLIQMAVRVYKKILPLPLPPPPPSFKKLKELYNGHLYTDCLGSLTLIFYQIYFTVLIHASTHQSILFYLVHLQSKLQKSSLFQPHNFSVHFTH